MRSVISLSFLSPCYLVVWLLVLSCDAKTRDEELGCDEGKEERYNRSCKIFAKEMRLFVGGDFAQRFVSSGTLSQTNFTWDFRSAQFGQTSLGSIQPPTTSFSVCEFRRQAALRENLVALCFDLARYYKASWDSALVSRHCWLGSVCAGSPHLRGGDDLLALTKDSPDLSWFGYEWSSRCTAKYARCKVRAKLVNMTGILWSGSRNTPILSLSLLLKRLVRAPAC